MKVSHRARSPRSRLSANHSCPPASLAKATSACLERLESRLHLDGEFGSVVTRGAVGAETANATAFDIGGNGIVGGSFTGVVDFSPGEVNVTFDAANGSGYVAKYNTAGNLIWARRVGGGVNDVAVDKDGNIFVTGSFNGTKDFDSTGGTTNLTSAGFEDIFVAKFNSSGGLQWAKRVGGSSFSDFGLGIAVDNAGYSYISGSFAGTVDFNPGLPTANRTAALTDGFVLRLNASGNFLRVSQLAGNGTERVNDLAVDAIGNVYATGNFDKTADFNPGAGTNNLISDASLGGNFDAFVWKIKSDGGYGFARRIGGGLFDSGEAIAIDALGQSYVTGRFTFQAFFEAGSGGTLNAFGASGSDVFIAKYDNQGGFEWAKKVGGGEHDESGMGIAVDGARNVYVTGFFRGIATLNPDGFFLVGSAGGTDAFVTKLTTDGAFVYGSKYGGTGNDTGNAIAVDAARGRVWAAGNFSNTVDFNAGSGVQSRTSAGGTDLFLLRLSQTSSPLQWAFNAGFGFSSDEGHFVELDSNGNVYVAGLVRGTPDLDPTAGVAGYGPIGGGADVFVAKFAPDGTYLWSRVATHREDETSLGAETIGGIAVDGFGNVIVVGTFRTTAAKFLDFPNTTQDLQTENTFTDGFIWKLNTNGGHVFSRKFGDENSETATGVAVDSLGNVYATGTFDFAVQWGPGASDEIRAGNFGAGESATLDVWVAKYSATGTIQWATASGGNGVDTPTDIEVEPGNGQLRVVGTFAGTSFRADRSFFSSSVSRSGTLDTFISRYNTSNGDGVSVLKLGGNAATRGTDLEIDASGNLFIAGDFTGTTDFDPQFGTANRTSKGNTDIFLVKISSIGTRLFSHAIGGTNADVATGIDIGYSGNVFVTGNFRGSVDFDPAPTFARTLNGGVISSFVWQVNNSGTFRSAHRFYSGANDIVIGAGGTAHVVGAFTAPTGGDFDPAANTFPLISSGGDIFVQKFTPGSTPSSPVFT